MRSRRHWGTNGALPSYQSNRCHLQRTPSTTRHGLNVDLPIACRVCRKRAVPSLYQRLDVDWRFGSVAEGESPPWNQLQIQPTDHRTTLKAFTSFPTQIALERPLVIGSRSSLWRAIQLGDVKFDPRTDCKTPYKRSIT